MIVKDLRPGGGRGEVSEANSRQRYDREVEGLDDGPVLEAPVEDRPREHQSARDDGQRLGLGVAKDGGDGPRQSPECKEKGNHCDLTVGTSASRDIAMSVRVEADVSCGDNHVWAGAAGTAPPTHGAARWAVMPRGWGHDLRAPFFSTAAPSRRSTVV
jgi:hypothetical protein